MHYWSLVSDNKCPYSLITIQLMLEERYNIQQWSVSEINHFTSLWWSIIPQNTLFRTWYMHDSIEKINDKE